MVTSVGSNVDPLLDRLSAAERRHKLASIAAHPTTFSVKDAAYYSNIGDAPDAGQFRAGFAVVVGYTKLLVSLVDGSSAAAWQSQAQSILSSLASLSGSAGLSAAVGPLNQIFGQLATAYSNASARRLVLSGKQSMIELIDALSNSGDAIFYILVEDDQPFASTKSAAERKTDIDATRLQVANYIVLLQQLKANFQQLSDAYLEQTSPEGLSAIASTAAALAGDAKAARAAYAALAGH
jgi:hypothetical protein